MSSVLQTDWTNVATFFVPPVVYLLTTETWSKRDNDYYAHLSANSSVFFLQGRAKIVFSIVWTAFFAILMPLAGFLYWRNDPVDTNLYSAGLALYWLSMLLLLGWFRIFFRMRAAKAAFFYTLVADACVIGFLACSALAGQVFSAVAFALLVVWLVIATMWTGVAAFAVPPMTVAQKEKEQAEEERESVNVMPVSVWDTRKTYLI